MWELQWNRRSESSGGNKKCKIGLLTDEHNPTIICEAQAKANLFLREPRKLFKRKRA